MAPQLEVPLFLRLCMPKRFECTAVMGVLRYVIQEVEDYMQEHYEDWTEGDPSKIRMATLPGRGRKRRNADDSLKEYVASSVAKAGRSYSSGAFARATGLSSASSALSWDESWMADYHAALHIEGNLVKTVCIAPDAARFGNPAQETMQYPTWLAEQIVGCWLPPQVPMGSTVHL